MYICIYSVHVTTKLKYVKSRFSHQEVHLLPPKRPETVPCLWAMLEIMAETTIRTRELSKKNMMFQPCSAISCTYIHNLHK